MTRRGRKAAEEQREFGSATAAMEWCVDQKVNLVFYHGANPFLN